MQKEKLNTLKKELAAAEKSELINFCLRLAKYKTENKEFLSYLIFHEHSPETYISDIKTMIEEGFKVLPKQFYYQIKGIRKLLRLINKYIKFLGNKEHEAAIILCFCNAFIKNGFQKSRQKSMELILERQFKRLEKAVNSLHEDLQFDFNQEILLIKDAM